MKILIVVTMTNNFGKKGSYNSQEIGLARGLAQLGHQVEVYKSVISDAEVGDDELDAGVMVHYIKCRCIGANGFLPVGLLDPSADMVIQFADVQLSVPSVYSWCRKNNIVYLPYVGITWSQSTNSMVRKLIDFIANRNFRIYRKTGCIAKNEKANKELLQKRIHHTAIAPVCLDFEQLRKDYAASDKMELRKKWNYGTERIILFIGRFEEDKRPLDMLRLFSKMDDQSAQLLMVGKGVYLNDAKQYTAQNNLRHRVRIIESMANKDIWELYRIADVFVNLNVTEIWGMVLLEAMYYRLGIVARNAPGPNSMIIDGETGYLCDSDEKILERLNNLPVPDEMREAAFDRVNTVFNWKKTAQKMLDFTNRK